MTTDDSPETGLDVTTVALELFKERSSQGIFSSRQLAVECFRDAAIFTNVAEEMVASGIDLLADDSNPLDEAYAPNLRRTHPINVMSREWGDLNKVQKILKELDANPAAESYEPFGWGKPEVNQARVLFPAVVTRAKQAALTK